MDYTINQKDPHSLFKPIEIRGIVNFRSYLYFPRYKDKLIESIYKTKDGRFKLVYYLRLANPDKYKSEIVDLLPSCFINIFRNNEIRNIFTVDWISFSEDNNSYFSWLTIGGLNTVGQRTWHSFSYPNEQWQWDVYNFIVEQKNQ